MKGWFTDLGTAYLASGVVDELPRKTLFAILSFISGYLPSAKKPAKPGKYSTEASSRDTYFFLADIKKNLSFKKSTAPSEK